MKGSKPCFLHHQPLLFNSSTPKLYQKSIKSLDIRIEDAKDLKRSLSSNQNFNLSSNSDIYIE